LRIRLQLERLPDAAREERIARLRALVADGSYVVEGERIADALLADDAIRRMLGYGPER
jgi:anti-sigma28 factor (negative regulator of flagellin synthesis)